MTNNPPEDEARKWALMHVYDQTEQIAYADKSKVKPLVEKAHLSGQSVGYARALEEVLLIVECWDEKHPVEKPSLYIEDLARRLKHLIEFCKAKGGA